MGSGGSVWVSRGLSAVVVPRHRESVWDPDSLTPRMSFTPETVGVVYWDGCRGGFLPEEFLLNPGCADNECICSVSGEFMAAIGAKACMSGLDKCGPRK